MLSLNGSPTLVYFMPTSGLIGVCEIHPTEISPTRNYYTVEEFLAAITPDPAEHDFALVAGDEIADAS